MNSVLLFRGLVSHENQCWCQTTNWDGGRGKWALPNKVKNFILHMCAQRFPKMLQGNVIGHYALIKRKFQDIRRCQRNAMPGVTGVFLKK